MKGESMSGAIAADLWKSRLAQRTERLTSSVIRDLLRLTEQPEIISFAGGLPAPECFPREELAAATERVLVEQPLAALQYGLTEGYGPLRDLIVEQLQGLGIAAAREQVIITNGSQQALDLLGMLLIDADAPVLVEDPTYLGALQAWRPRQPRFVPIPVDEEGLDVARLANLLADGLRPRFLYVMSCFQNPMGVTLTPARRQALIDLAARYAFPIVEDDPYGELAYDGARPAPLAALDVALHGQLRYVVYISTFSKLLAPGMRVGWTAAPRALIGKLAQAKEGTDLQTGSLAQATAYEACRAGLLNGHVPFIRDTYRVRRDTMLAALAEHMPAGVHWTRPGGGMFIWLTLPPHLDATALFHAALEYQVSFVPGASFYANGGGTNTLRLSFSLPTPERIREGIARLGGALREAI